MGDPRFGPGRVDPAYDRVVDPGVQAVLAANPSGVQVAGNLTFGPAVPQQFLQHATDCCIVRGLDMATNDHQAGYRYLLTGKPPRGLAANGSSLPTVVAAQAERARELPNVAVLTEAYNDGLPVEASAVRFNGALEVNEVLRRNGAALAQGSSAAVRAYRAQAERCLGHLDGEGLASRYGASREAAAQLVASQVADAFDFNLANPSPKVAPVLSAMGIATSADLSGPRGLAALAAQALASGTTQAVSVRLATNLDNHTAWTTDHAGPLRLGFEMLGRIIGFLKSQQYPGTNQSVWELTTLVAFSEFGRTYNVNGSSGRDHNLCSSVLLAGPGIKGNTVVGASTDDRLVPRRINLQTGAPDDLTGVQLRPSDVHATVLRSMGLSDAALSNQAPQILSAVLR
jgi:hypothetical protein